MVEVYREFKDTGYLIGRGGHVMNKKFQLLSQQKHYKGHMKIGISVRGKTKSMFVHRLVALVYLRRKKDCNIVNHKDAIKIHNVWTNLEWTTISGNTKHAYDMGLIDMDYVRSCRTNEKQN